MSRAGGKDSTRRRELDALYAELPTIQCRGRCADACGPIQMSRVEWARMIDARGKRKATTIMCPYLEKERCIAYRVRPMICRLWGVVESLKCPWGCEPSPRYLTHTEGHDFILRAELISEPQHAEEIEKMRQWFRDNPRTVHDITDLFVSAPVKT